LFEHRGEQSLANLLFAVLQCREVFAVIESSVAALAQPFDAADEFSPNHAGSIVQICTIINTLTMVAPSCKNSHPGDLSIPLHLASERELRQLVDSASTPQHSCLEPSSTGKRPVPWPHLIRMTLAMKQDVALDPLNLALLGAGAVVAYAQRDAHPIQPTGFWAIPVRSAEWADYT
jgi:hypothetical protein